MFMCEPIRNLLINNKKFVNLCLFYTCAPESLWISGKSITLFAENEPFRMAIFVAKCDPERGWCVWGGVRRQRAGLVMRQCLVNYT